MTAVNQRGLVGSWNILGSPFGRGFLKECLRQLAGEADFRSMVWWLNLMGKWIKVRVRVELISKRDNGGRSGSNKGLQGGDNGCITVSWGGGGPMTGVMVVRFLLVLN